MLLKDVGFNGMAVGEHDARVNETPDDKLTKNKLR
jgi:hypothetical protein